MIKGCFVILNSNIDGTRIRWFEPGSGGIKLQRIKVQL